MSDDLANKWGTSLCHITREDNKKFSSQSSQLIHSEFKRNVDKYFNNDFIMQKVLADGSTANVFAIFDASNGDTSRCLIAAGSYLCADQTLFSNLATSEFYLNSSLSCIRVPDAADDLFVRRTIIALPYAVKGAIDEEALALYEDKCFEALQEKLLLYRIQMRAVRCIFLELMLAGNGAMLSDRALSKIAKLSVLHQFTVIVDEIMTGGRTGSLLMLQTKPDAFIKCVSHVTLGKWLNVGMILISKARHEEGEKMKRVTSPRSNSTYLDLKPVVTIWNKVVSLIPSTEVRRQIVLKKIKCDENDAWGEGCLIFLPSKNNTINGLKNRLLPLLDPWTPIDANISSPKVSLVTKISINKNLMNSINQWKDVDICDDDNTCDNTDIKDMLYILIIRHFAEQFDSDGQEFATTTEEIHNVVLKKHNISFHKSAEMLRKFEKIGILEYKLVGLKRLRCWIVRTDLMFI